MRKWGLREKDNQDGCKQPTTKGNKTTKPKQKGKPDQGSVVGAAKNTGDERERRVIFLTPLRFCLFFAMS